MKAPPVLASKPLSDGESPILNGHPPDAATPEQDRAMNFGFTEEQELLRAEVRKFLDQNAPLDEVRKIVETAAGYEPNLWNRMAELGWVGLTMPEAHGGVGLDFVTLVVLLEETGRSLFPSPLLSTVLAAKAIEACGSAAQQARWLPRLADGSRIGTFALLEESDSFAPESIALVGKRDGGETVLSGRKRIVPDAGQADLFVVAHRSAAAPAAGGTGAVAHGLSQGLSLAVVERGAPGVSVEEFPVMDLTKRCGQLTLDEVRVAEDAVLGEAGQAAETIGWLVDVGATLVAAEAVGSAEEALGTTTEFAREREQFDSKIGRFQGVKHPLAEMYVDVESFKSLVYFAAWCLDNYPAWSLDNGSDDVPLAASRAKAYASDAFARLGIEAVQLHGGVGYTDEYDIQLYLKRSKWVRPAFGDADHHYARIAALGGL
jgi:alkylation response protein AidB-like acyl-CoA dehydrogenase